VKLDKSRQQRIIALTIVAILLLAIVLIALDWSEVRQIVGKADWKQAFVALAFTLISYLCLSFGYVLVNRAFTIRIAWRELFEVGFVSTTLNNILAFLGAAGHSLRLALIRRRGVAAGEILAASIFHSYINNVMMLILLAVGLIWLLISHTVYGGRAISLSLIAGMLVFSLVVATAMVFVSRLRAWIFRMTNAVWHLVTRRDITSLLTEFNKALTHGLVALRGRWLVLVLILGLMAGDWAFAAIALWFCFAALGHTPGLGILLSGFGIGISAGNLSMIPGGLGVQESSMAGVYALLGISLAQAFLASILFRVVYDFVPFFLSLALYRRLIRKRNQANTPTDNGSHLR
jgi:uncharacterized protein (TIRG00374 family)